MTSYTKPVIPVDIHYTPDAVADAVIDRLIYYQDITQYSRVLDPCCGKGAFPDAIRRRIPNCDIVTNDLDRSVEADYHSDFTEKWGDEDETRDFDCVCSNPPFSLFTLFVIRGLLSLEPSHVGTVAYILPLASLALKRNSDFLAQYKPLTVDIIRPRPFNYVRECALVRWTVRDVHLSGPTKLGFLDWK